MLCSKQLLISHEHFLKYYLHNFKQLEKVHTKSLDQSSLAIVNGLPLYCQGPGFKSRSHCTTEPVLGGENVCNFLVWGQRQFHKGLVYNALTSY